MSEETTETVETETPETETQDQVENKDSEHTVEDPAAGLKSALQKERAARKEAEKRERELKRQLEDVDKTADEKAREEAQREAIAEAVAKANRRLIAAEFRTAAAKRVKDPRIAEKLATESLSDIDVDDDGNVDSDGIAGVLDALLQEYPDLAPSRFEGTADQGHVDKQDMPSQLTENDLSHMSPEQISAARKEGRLNKILGIQT